MCVCHREVLSEMLLPTSSMSHPFIGQEGQLPRSYGSPVGFVCVVRSGPGAFVKLYLSVFPPAFILPVTHFNIPFPTGRLSPVLNTSGESSSHPGALPLPLVDMGL